jgi:ElaB/YqjD/DUF883 family membrane-anchored ribosome-binding protein
LLATESPRTFRTSAKNAHPIVTAAQNFVGRVGREAASVWATRRIHREAARYFRRTGVRVYETIHMKKPGRDQGSTAQASSDKLLDDLKTVVNDAEELLRATAGQAGERMSEARARAEASVRAARERLSTVQDDVLEHTKEMAEEADAYVRENPWQAVGIAAAAGIILGLMLRR